MHIKCVQECQNMEFRVLDRNTQAPYSSKDTVYLKIDHWNDYSFITMFHVSVYDKNGQLFDIGEIKIGFRGQTTETATYDKLPREFGTVGDEFFSLGQGVEFYRNLEALPSGLGKQILVALRDIVIQPEIIEDIREEKVFSTSLLRGISLSLVKGQYARVLVGMAELTTYRFKFVKSKTEHFEEIGLSFDVKVDSIPSTNIHALIGRNGVGKTTFLNSMIETITKKQGTNSKFIDIEGWQEEEILDEYFSSLVSVSFSAFDPFTPPQEQPDPAKGTCYFYIGLKDPQNRDSHRTISNLQTDCVKALTACFHEPKKTKRWLNAIDKLSSDENFASMQLERLEVMYRELHKNINSGEQSDSMSFREKYKTKVVPLLSSMSSGHAIVLLTITRLVSTVEEKTLVLLDEPESHLHPPLLSAFVRALADLLHDRNGVAIIATHSPVVLQEIPCSCVWKIYRVGTNVTVSRPNIETFGENVGTLTSEVFSLEVERSGFHALLTKSVEAGRTYKEILSDYNDQLGFEGRAILKALIANRGRGNNHDTTE